MIKYRPEIDGLRALAIIPVILFHAGFQCFSGGFIGVDVFFVISGYLITSIILLEKNFSLLNFYERRARRILPALFFVMLATLPFTWFYLMPNDAEALLKSLWRACFFSSNLLFNKQSGYFDTAAELKPFIHTWSLAIEEQFYLFFPFLLLLLGRSNTRFMTGAVLIILLCSLGYAQYLVKINPSAAFFLLPSRLWELLIGALVAFYFVNRKKLLSKKINQSVSLLGFLLIIYAILRFNKETPFPSLHALIPTLGAGCIILCASKETFIGKLLANKFMVGIGLVSYSAYLWHQPIFAFSRHIYLGSPPLSTMILLALLSFFIAFISWKFIESPFRDRNKFSRKNILYISILSISFFTVLSFAEKNLSSQYKDFWISHQSDEIRNTYRIISSKNYIEPHDEAFSKIHPQNDCRFNVDHLTQEIKNKIIDCHKKYHKGFAILGDSHSIDLYALISYQTNEPFLIGVTQGSCRPNGKESGQLNDLKNNCQYDEFLSFIQTNKNIFKAIIYEQAGFYFLKTQYDNGKRQMFSAVPLDQPLNSISINEAGVMNTYNYLSKLGQYSNVVWFGPRIEPHINEGTILKLGCKYSYQLRPNQKEIFEKLDDFIQNITNEKQPIIYISQIKSFNFKFPDDFMDCSHIYWRDGDHYSEPGRLRFSERIQLLPKIKKALASRGL